jgi:hypothetical protein
MIHKSEAKPPVVEAKPPVVEAKPPVVEARPPVVEARPPVVEAKPPVVEAKPPVVETRPPVVEAKPPVVEAKPPVVEARPPVVEAKPPVVEAKETSAGKPVVELAEDSDGKPVVELAEDSDGKPAEDSNGKPAAKLAEDHADAEKKSTPESKKKQKQYFIPIVAVLLIGGIGGLQLDQIKALNQVQQLQASLKQAEKSARNSKIGQSVLSGFGQLTQAVLSISGRQAPHAIDQAGKPLVKDLALNDEEASHTTYEVSKPLVKDLTLNDEYVCQIRAIQHIEIRSLEKGYLQNVLIDEGQAVRQGQLLFQIKPNVYEADVQKSEAEVDLSKIELQNNQALVAKDIIEPRLTG